MNLPKRTNLDALNILVSRFLVTIITPKLPRVAIKRDVYQSTAFLWMEKSTLNQTNHGRKRGHCPAAVKTAVNMKTVRTVVHARKQGGQGKFLG